MQCYAYTFIANKFKIKFKNSTGHGLQTPPSKQRRAAQLTRQQFALK